jgi:undecaprenyl-diphosphatase
LIDVELGATGAEDRSLDLSLHSAFGHPSYRFFELMSTVGGGTVRVVAIALIVLGLAITRRWWSAILAIVAVEGAGLLETLFKLLVGRPRPHLFPHVVQAGGSSFPSGHATDTCALALVAVYLVWHLWGRRSLTILAGALLFILTLLVGLSRIVLGVHYPTDVAGGYALGAGWVALMVALFAPALHGETTRAHPHRAGIDL